jgi:hypothetical protein
MENPRTRRDTQFEEILRVVESEGLLGEEMTAKEIHEAVESDASVSSPHEVATVLGYHSDDPAVEVEEGSPYRYRFD